MDRYLVVDGAGTMSVFEIYIKTTPGAPVGGDHRPGDEGKYSFGVQTRLGLERGLAATCPGSRASIDIAEGENVEVDPPRRLVQSINALWSDDVKAVGTSRVTWEIEPVGDSCRLTVTHDQLPADANSELYGGWTMILSGPEDAAGDRRDPGHAGLAPLRGVLGVSRAATLSPQQHVSLGGAAAASDSG